MAVELVYCWEIEDIPCNTHPVKLCDEVQCKELKPEELESEQNGSGATDTVNIVACPPGTNQIRRDANGDGNNYPVWRPSYISNFGHMTFNKVGEVDCTLETPCSSGDCALGRNGKYVCQKDAVAVERKVAKPVVQGVNRCVLFEKDQSE